MQVVIPLAGKGDRFLKEGWETPKPLIEVDGVPMIQRAVETLGIEGQYHFVVRKYDRPEWNGQLAEVLNSIVDSPQITTIDYITQGPAISASLPNLDPQDQLVVANCDQILFWNPDNFINYVNFTACDGSVVTYESTKSCNSYAKIDVRGWVTDVREKEVISKYSLNGIHYWKEASSFLWSLDQMIQKDIRVNGEFYVAPTYNEIIARGDYVTIYNIPSDYHWAVGKPDDLKLYQESSYASKSNI